MTRLSHSSEVGPVDKVLLVAGLVGSDREFGLIASALMGSVGLMGFDVFYHK